MKGITALLALTAIVGAANAQQMISQDGRPERMSAIWHSNGISALDKKSLQTLYYGNAFEIKTSEIARRRGQSMWTKEFAKEMIHEHTAAQNELKMLAEKKGVMLSNDLPKDMQKKLTTLSSVPASKFDAKYKAIQMAAHSGASMALQTEIKTGHDEMVRSFAIKLLPAVKDHYSMIMMKKTMMGSTAM